MKIEIQIEIDKIKIDEKYFSFDYELIIDGKLIVNTYSSDYSGYNCKEDFISVLKNGRAYQCVLNENGYFNL